MAVEGLHYLFVAGSKGAAPIHVNEFTELEGTDCTESGLCSSQAVHQAHHETRCSTLRSTIQAVAGFPTCNAADIRLKDTVGHMTHSCTSSRLPFPYPALKIMSLGKEIICAFNC